MKRKLKKGDTVVIMTGKDKGKTGVIERVHPLTGRVIVAGVNKVKRHTKAKGGQSSRIIETERSIDISNVMLMDPTEKKPTRVGRKLEEGRFVRFAKKSGITLA